MADIDEAKKIVAPKPRIAKGRIVEVPRTIRTFDTDESRPVKQKLRSDFRPEEFIRLLEQHGKHIIWRKAMLCVCLNKTTGQAEVDCPECNAGGFIYVDPIAIRAHMVQFDKKTSIYEKFGLWQEGSVNITTEPKYRLGYRDSIEMRDSVIPFNELLFKNNRRGLRSKLPTNVDSARYRIANMTKLVFKKKSDKSLFFLEENYHFRITREGWIQWLEAGNRAVPDEATLSAHYDFHPVFLVLSWFHVTRDDVSGRKSAVDRVIAHPIQAMAKLDFLIDVNDAPNTTAGAVAEPSGVGNA